MLRRKNSVAEIRKPRLLWQQSSRVEDSLNKERISETEKETERNRKKGRNRTNLFLEEEQCCRD